jgi:hypothetical protein
LLSWVCSLALMLASFVAPAAAKTKHKTKSSANSSKPTTVTSTAKSTSTKKSTSARKTGKSAKASSKSAKGRKGKAARKPRGQQAIQSERAREIQSALIREHYLDGQPSGEWDTQTRAALVKFQGDNGWQTKVVPDSRALIKLGLGPDHSKTLNPEALNRPEVARDQVPGGAQNR